MESGPGQSEGALERDSWWASRLPSAFVVLSLVAILVVPLVIGRDISALRTEIANVVEPARGRVEEIRAALALEIAAISKFLITGDERFVAEYRRALAEERAAFGRLEPLARKLGPEIWERYIALRTLARRWNEWVVERNLFGDPASAEELPRRIALEQSFYEDVIAAADRLEAALTAVAERKRSEIRSAERIETVLTIALAVVALAAAAVVFRLGRRLRALAREAENRRRRVEEVLESRTRFLRGLSHDLKNPLGAVGGYADLLSSGVQGELTGKQEQAVTRIRRSARRAVQLVDDLLDLSRAESGQLPVDRRPTDPGAFMAEVVEDHEAAIADAALELETDLPDALPTLVTDPSRARQIVDNLVSNATKYTPAGGRVRIAVDIRAGEGAPGGGRWLAVAVEDTGPGIPRKERERIFEEFYRSEGVREDGRGTGLGLAMSRRIAELLGGDVTVESTVGAGSTFTLWLPVQDDGRE